MKEQIQRFIEAQKVFREATHQLNTAVSIEIVKRNTEEELMDLISDLPPSYIGTRRIYEKIERLKQPS